MLGDVLFTIGGILIAAACKSAAFFIISRPLTRFACCFGSDSLPQFIVGRIFMGGGAGIAAVVCAVYLGEVAPSNFRGRVVAVQSV